MYDREAFRSANENLVADTVTGNWYKLTRSIATT